MKILTSFFLLLSLNAFAYETVEEVATDLNRIFESKMSQYADEIRGEREAMNDLSDEEIFVTRNCEPTSVRFIKEVKKVLKKSKIIRTKGHVYIEATAKLNGKETRLVIDPTYRQFFAIAVKRLFREPTGKDINGAVLEKFPVRVLAVETKDLRKTMEEGFPEKPEWLVEHPIFGAPSTYEKWYLEY